MFGTGSALEEALGTIAERKKIKKDRTYIFPLMAIIVLIIFLFIIGYIVRDGNVGSKDDWDYIHIEQRKIDDGWLITVTDSHRGWEDKPNSGFPLNEVKYKIPNETWELVSDISGKFSENNTIIFFDNNNDDLFTVGDTFFISNNIINSGQSFWIGLRKFYGVGGSGPWSLKLK